jgi:hypothetical protein
MEGQEYVKQEYPKTLYKKAANDAGYETVVVDDPDEHAAMGDGWEDSPAKCGVETAPAKPGSVAKASAKANGKGKPAPAKK